MSFIHPLDQLQAQEVSIARETIIQSAPQSIIKFRSIFLLEPTKADLAPFLLAEHNGTLSVSTPRPPRLAQVYYDIVRADKSHNYFESVVDVNARSEISRQGYDASYQPSLSL